MVFVPPRAVVEQLVRKAVYQRLGRPVPHAAPAPSPLVVSVSARHCHLSDEAVRALFGSGHRLTPMRDLLQPGQFAAQETVTLVGPRSRVIPNLRVLGPSRGNSQVELAYSDAVTLGFELPTRLSGDLDRTPGCMLMGPTGFFELRHGVIRALRHVHMSPTDAAFYGVAEGQDVRLVVGGDCAITLEKIRVRVHPDYALEVHMDTDEGNACNLRPETPCELVR
ncbi:MAG: phosphate propanoyltransferase [Polyangiaceae bacterium]|nr:phosphate propanoyltransferase [Polyangiaceae bacterium]